MTYGNFSRSRCRPCPGCGRWLSNGIFSVRGHKKTWRPAFNCRRLAATESETECDATQTKKFDTFGKSPAHSSRPSLHAQKDSHDLWESAIFGSRACRNLVLSRLDHHLLHGEVPALTKRGSVTANMFAPPASSPTTGQAFQSYGTVRQEPPQSAIWIGSELSPSSPVSLFGLSSVTPTL
jgi:hypothetical protein